MLGFILAPLGQQVPGQYPNEINYAYSGAGTYLCPDDPQYNTQGEPGLYYDTQLGGPAIPTDAELATVYGYTPVAAGWINAAEGFMPGPWRTPGGWNPAGAYGPPTSLSGLRDATMDPGDGSGAAPADSPQTVADVISAQNSRVFVVSVISAVVVGAAALLNSYRLMKQLKRDEILFAQAKRR